MAAGLRQFLNKQEEVMECTDLGEERKQRVQYLCQPIGLKSLKHFIPEGNSKWAAQSYKCTSASV